MPATPARRRGYDAARKSALTKGTEEEPRVRRLAVGEREDHRRAGRDLARKQDQRRAERRGCTHRGECRQGRTVYEEERADTADADAGVLENRAAPFGSSPDHQSVAHVEDAVGVVQARGDEHHPKRESGRDAGGTTGTDRAGGPGNPVTIPTNGRDGLPAPPVRETLPAPEGP